MSQPGGEGQTQNSWLSKKTGLIALIAVVVILLGLWLLLPDYSKVATSAACPEAPAPPESPPLTEGVAPVPLILEKAEGVVVNFWRDRASQSRTVFLQVAKKSPPSGNTSFAILNSGTTFSVSERSLERQELDGVIGPAQYVATASVTSLKEISLTICVDPSQADIDPGTYSGSVRIVGGAIQPVTVPVSVTLQYPGYRWIVPVMSVVILLAGSFLVWAAGKKAAARERSTWTIWGDLSELPGWMANNYVGVVGGAIAAISVFIVKYWRTPPWGAKAPEDWFALLGSMFTAFTATLTAAAALIPAAQTPPPPAEPSAVDQGAPGSSTSPPPQSATAEEGERAQRSRRTEGRENERG